MRLVRLVTAAALAAGGVALAGPAGAYQCPRPLLENHTYYVAGQPVNACRLGHFIDCDPDPCWSPAR